MLGLAAWILRNRLRVDPSLAAWRRFTARLAKRGIAWRSWEGPLAFAERAAKQMPVHAEAIAEIAALYARLRYAPGPRASEFEQLKAKIAAFKP
jgi:MoxR-like ATPase